MWRAGDVPRLGHMARTDVTSRRRMSERRTKLRLTVKSLLALHIVASGILSAWCVLFRPAARIREPAAGEELVGSCFSVGSAEGPKRCRAIFAVDGRLLTRHCIVATLYSVQKGRVRQVSAINVGVPARPTTDVFPSDFHVQFALCECDQCLPSALMLGVAGPKRAVGAGSPLFARPRAANGRVFPGPVPKGRAIIAYVEGDNSVVQPMMPVAAFAESNSAGDYIVVTVQMVWVTDALTRFCGAADTAQP